ncbi:hypothetical protein SS209_02659 [Salmonella enterica subsp. enterica serovar Senftenberg str. SS209]|nr:hypothetical protein SS209_02659 [Salmonella enterica subsp. enterica serovar Senftenberg str. SS209]
MKNQKKNYLLMN